MHRCRVLMLLENCGFPRDGRVRQEARTLVDAGHLVIVVCPAGPGQPFHELLDGVLVYRYPEPPAGDSLGAYLWEYGYAMACMLVIAGLVLVRHGVDVVHTHNPPDTLVFIAALFKLLGRRFVFDHHDLAPEMYEARFGSRARPAVRAVLLATERLCCRLADHVIATNGSYREVEMTRGRVPAARITVVRNGPALDRLRPIEGRSDSRHDGKTLIVYVGVMGFQDGVEYLLRALHHLAQSLHRTDFRCLLVGAGDALASLRSLSETLDLSSYVRFTGWVEHDDVLTYLNAADICVAPEPSNPYTDRSTAIKLMEYMAVAKPIVAFDLPEHRFTAQAAAVYAPPNDTLAFARAIVELMDDPARCRAMGAIGRGRIENELAWHHQAPGLLEVYRRQSVSSGSRATGQPTRPGAGRT